MLIDVLVKATVVLGAAALFSAVTRGRVAASVRHAVWVAALAGVLAMPVLTAALPALRLPVLPQRPAFSPLVDLASQLLPLMRMPVAADGVTVPDPVHESQAVRTAPAAADRTPRSIDALAPAGGSSLPAVSGDLAAGATTGRSVGGSEPVLATTSWLLIVWLVGAAAMCLRLAMATWLAARVARTGLPGHVPWLSAAQSLARRLGVRAHVRFIRSGAVQMPMACGVLRSAVVLPSDADHWADDRLNAVLLHELAHVQRRDCLTQAVAELAVAALWFHPLAWMALRAVRSERERACDDLVLASGTPAPAYASHLLDMARAARRRTATVSLMGGVAMAHPSELEGRLMAILDEARPRRALTTRSLAGTAVLSLAVVTPMAALDPWSPLHATRHAPPSLGTTQPEGRQTGATVTAGAIGRARAALVNAPLTNEPAGLMAEAQTGPTPTPTPSPSPMVAPAPPVRPTTPPSPPSLVRPVLAGRMAFDIRPDFEWQDGPSTPADPRVVAALTAALKDTDQEVREHALHALARFRDPSTIDAFVAILGESDADMRRHAASALSRFRDPRAQQALSGIISDADPELRRQAVSALAQQRDPSTIPALTTALQDTDGDVRQHAAVALGRLRNPQAVPALTAALEDSDADVRRYAVFALGQLRDPLSLAPLAAALQDTDAEVRQQAAFALAQLRDPRAVEPLMVAATDQNVDVRRQAFFALGQLRDSRAQDLTLAALKDPDPQVRRAAAHALSLMVKD